jgi:hypothetical protein
LAETQNPPAVTSRTITFARVFVVAVALEVLGLSLAGVLFLAALFSRQGMIGKAAAVALVICFVGAAITEACLTWARWRSGAWIGLDGMRRTRAERPGWFRTWVATHMLAAAGLACAAGFLSWSLLSGAWGLFQP